MKGVKMKTKQKTVVLLIFFLIILFTSYGYAALNTSLSISGEAYVRVEEGVRITDIKIVSSENGGFATYNPKYSKDTTSMFVTLPTNSSIIYEIEVTNKTTQDYMLVDLIPDNTDLNYELLDFKIYDVIDKQSVKKIRIKVKNNSSNTLEKGLNLNYTFSEAKVTPPVLKGGENWTNSPTTVSVAEHGIAPNGLKYYEYYVTESRTDTPTKDTTPTGTTSNSYDFVEGGIYYIFYRTISNNGMKSEWTSMHMVKNYKLPMKINFSSQILVPSAQQRLSFDRYDCIVSNSKVNFNFIFETDGQFHEMDFNDVAIEYKKTDLGNNRYNISGIVNITEYMIAGLPEREFAYNHMKFIDIASQNSSYLNFINGTITIIN